MEHEVFLPYKNHQKSGNDGKWWENDGNWRLINTPGAPYSQCFTDPNAAAQPETGWNCKWYAVLKIGCSASCFWDPLGGLWIQGSFRVLLRAHFHSGSYLHLFLHLGDGVGISGWLPQELIEAVATSHCCFQHRWTLKSGKIGFSTDLTYPSSAPRCPLFLSSKRRPSGQCSTSLISLHWWIGMSRHGDHPRTYLVVSTPLKNMKISWDDQTPNISFQPCNKSKDV